jgi:hypothetical protein
MRIHEAVLINIVLLAVVTLITVLTLQLGPVARLVPILVAIPTLGFLLFQLALDLMPGLSRRFRFLEKKDPFNVESLNEESLTRSRSRPVDRTTPAKTATVVLWVLLMFPLTYLLGFSVALPLYTLLYLRLRSKESWLLSASIALGMLVFVRGALVHLFGIQLYKGELWSLLRLM